MVFDFDRSFGSDDSFISSISSASSGRVMRAPPSSPVLFINPPPAHQAVELVDDQPTPHASSFREDSRTPDSDEEHLALKNLLDELRESAAQVDEHEQIRFMGFENRSFGQEDMPKYIAWIQKLYKERRYPEAQQVLEWASYLCQALRDLPEERKRKTSWAQLQSQESLPEFLFGCKRLREGQVPIPPPEDNL